MSNKDNKNYEKVALNVVSDDIGTIYNKTEYKSSICNYRSLLIFIGLLLCLCIGFGAGYFMGETNVLSDDFNGNGDDQFAAGGNEISLQKRCENRRCCQYRDENQVQPINGINCKSFKVEQCVENDEVCLWECDETVRRRKGKFVGFDQGKGIVRDDIGPPDNGHFEDIGPPQSIEEILERGKGFEFGPCGDVYESNMDFGEAAKIFEDREKRGRASKGPNGKVFNIEDWENEGPGSPDMGENGDDVRRLTIIGNGDDGRIQSLSTNTYPNTAFGLLISNTGVCSATLISKRVILTAAHCVYDTGSNQWIYGWTFYPDATGTPLPTGYGWSSVWVSWGWASQTTTNGYFDNWSSSRDYDYAMIRLKDEVGASKGYLEFGYDNLLSSAYLFTAGYPGDKPSGTRWHQHCHYDDWRSNQFRSTENGGGTCDVFAGQSGSPVYKYSAGQSASPVRIIYGVTSGEALGEYNVYCRIDSVKVNTICDYIKIAEPDRC